MDANPPQWQTPFVKLSKHTGYQAVLVTSPDYYGTSPDLPSLAAVCDQRVAPCWSMRPTAPISVSRPICCPHQPWPLVRQRAFKALTRPFRL